MKPEALEQVVALALIIGGVASALIGVQTFYIGEHNIDLSYNMALIAIDFRDGDYRDWTDTANTGQNITFTQLYSIGLNQMENGLMVVSLGLFCFGFGVSRVYKKQNTIRNRS